MNVCGPERDMSDGIKEGLLSSMECGSVEMTVTNCSHLRGHTGDADIFRGLRLLASWPSMPPALFLPMIPVPFLFMYFLSLPNINGIGEGASYRNLRYVPDLKSERNTFEL